MPTNTLRRAHYILLVLGLAYAAVLGLLTIPLIQRELLFLHHVPIPPFANFANPEKYGLAPYKTRNLRLNTSDGETIGAWHVLPASVYHALDPFPPQTRGSVDEAVFEHALTQRPTIIYFHGNAGNRATSHRVRSYSAFSNNLDCNVLAIDYRGFGDSSGVPSEHGLLLDARAAYQYVARVVSEDKVLLVGQSLGTGVVASLAGSLAKEGIFPRALVLIAPFTSITELLTSYKIIRYIPILGPLDILPSAQRFFQSFLQHPFNSTAALANTSSPTLLLHAVNDHTIPHSHSARLYASLVPDSSKETEVVYDGWGTVRSADRGAGGTEVVWWQGRQGGHDNLGWAEGTLDLIARIAAL